MEKLLPTIVCTGSVCFLLISMSALENNKQTFLKQHTHALAHRAGALSVESAKQSANRRQNAHAFISVIYFSAVNPGTDWKSFFTRQLGDFASCGLADRANVDIILSSLDNGSLRSGTLSLLQAARKHVRSILPQANITLCGVNQYEFPGIQRVWEIAHGSDDPANHIVLYFHGKGMVNGHGPQSDLNSHLMRTVVEPWRRIVPMFESDRQLSRVGYAMGTRGNAWFNFWWARASYLTDLVEPQITHDRYYYEHWLGMIKAERVPDPANVLMEYTGDGASCQRIFPPAFGYSGFNNSLSLCPGAQGLKNDVSFPEDLDLIMATCAPGIKYVSTMRC